MSKRDWCNGLTVGLTLGFGVGLVLLLLLEASSPTIHPPSGEITQCNPAADDCANNGEGVPDRWYWPRRLLSLEDTLAQWIMMIFTVAAAVLLLFTLKATQKMARDTQRIGEAEVRAHPIISELHIGSDKIAWQAMQVLEARNDLPASDLSDKNLHVRVKIENFGNTHARDVAVLYSLKIQQIIKVDGTALIAERQSKNRFVGENHHPVTGTHLKASGDLTKLIMLNFPLTKREVSTLAGGGDQYLVVGVVASLFYRDVFDKVIKVNFGFTGNVPTTGFNALQPAGEWIWYRQDELNNRPYQ